MNSQNQTLQPAAPHAQAISTGSMLAQVSSVLAVIILLILACAWLARRAGFAPKKVSGQELKLTASVPVGQRARVVIIDPADARLVLVVTAQQITHLHMLPPGEPVAVTPPARAPPDPPLPVQNLVKLSG